MKKKILQIDSKWSETRKKHETKDPSAATADDRRRRRPPILRLEYVNTSYHTTFHQNISINVACIHKKSIGHLKVSERPPPFEDTAWSDKKIFNKTFFL